MCLHDGHWNGSRWKSTKIYWKWHLKSVSCHVVHSWATPEGQKWLPVVFTILNSMCWSLKKNSAKCDGQVGVKCMGVLFVLSRISLFMFVFISPCNQCLNCTERFVRWERQPIWYCYQECFYKTKKVQIEKRKNGHVLNSFGVESSHHSPAFFQSNTWIHGMFSLIMQG